MASSEETKEVTEEKKEEAEQNDKQEEVAKKEEDDEGAAKEGEKGSPETKPKENGETPTPGTPKPASLRDQFKSFSKFGDTKSDGKLLTLSQSDKWMKQAGAIDGKSLTTTDTAIHFKKFKQMKINFTDYEKYLEALAKAKKLDVAQIKEKLQNCGPPGTSGTTAVMKTNTVNRLTDTKKYTGSHKLRFDETGKGKGIAGRKDKPETGGYVSGYKNKDSYDKSH